MELSLRIYYTIKPQVNKKQGQSESIFIMATFSFGSKGFKSQNLQQLQ